MDHNTVKQMEFDTTVIMETFQARTDIVAEKWISKKNGKSGYSPICKNKWKKGKCQIGSKSGNACDGCEYKEYTELSNDLIQKHIEGKIILGVYPLLDDNTCHFIAGDFDNHDGKRDPLSDVKAFYYVCEVQEIPCYILRSSSGNGFHAYIFFSSAVPAWKARIVMFALLREADVIGEDQNLSSFDRLFPNQDEHSNGRIGNLIALPFQGEASKNGHTLILDPESGFADPYENQMEILTNIDKIDEQILDKIIENWELKKPPTNQYTCSPPVENNYPEAEYNLIKHGCPFIFHCETDASSLSEPEWWSMVTIVCQCKDGKSLVHELSEPYPKYDHSETERKVDDALKCGPHTCRYIMDNINSSYCPSCLNYGIVKSPVVIGLPAVCSLNMYDQEIEKLNQQHAVVMSGGKCVVLNEIDDPCLNRPDINFSTISDFRNRYHNRKVSNPNKGKGQSKQISIADVWLDSPLRRQYEGIIFNPSGDVQSHYNLFRGFAFQPKQGDWSLMRDHIETVICNGDAAIFEWVLAWMARIVQDPGGERPGTCVALRGKQGSGKGALITNFGKIFGVHFVHLSNPKHVVGNFNSHLKDALFVFVDEGFWSADKAAEGILKAMITEETNLIEQKGKDAFPVKNHINIMMASNKNWILPAGLEERRFCVLDISDKKAGDIAYFNALYHQMDNGGREAMLYDLMQVDHSKIDLRTIPRTEALFDQIIASMDTVKKFWYQRLCDGSILETDAWWFSNMYLETKKIYDEYTAFAALLKEKDIKVMSQFSKEIGQLCPGAHRKRKQLSNGNNKKESVMKFPPVAKCRKQFEALIKKTIQWNDDGIVDDEDP